MRVGANPMSSSDANGKGWIGFQEMLAKVGLRNAARSERVEEIRGSFRTVVVERRQPVVLQGQSPTRLAFFWSRRGCS